MTQSKFAELAGVSRSNITYFVNGGAPRDELFRSIFMLWNSEATSAHLFRAHIHDEAERAGLDANKMDTGSVQTAELLAVEEDLHALRVLLISNVTVRPFIRRLAQDFRSASRNTIKYPVASESLAVAEDPSAYPAKKPAAKPAKKKNARK